eukprot:1615112-Amphidinium_carterae.1
MLDRKPYQSNRSTGRAIEPKDEMALCDFATCSQHTQHATVWPHGVSVHMQAQESARRASKTQSDEIERNAAHMRDAHDTP